MAPRTLLIVDDEHNIRLTLSEALQGLGLAVKTAVNGEEALCVIEREDVAVVLLDLRMPGIDGLEVLRRLRLRWPGVRVAILTAHGTVASAVEAMKLGAVDFLEKPFRPDDVRGLVQAILDRESLEEAEHPDVESLIHLAKRHVTDRRFADAEAVLRRVVGEDPARPEAYNLLGAVLEIRGDAPAARRFYRAALSIDPRYGPAWSNLDRITSFAPGGGIQLEEPQEPGTPPSERRRD